MESIFVDDWIILLSIFFFHLTIQCTYSLYTFAIYQRISILLDILEFDQLLLIDIAQSRVFLLVWYYFVQLTLSLLEILFPFFVFFQEDMLSIALIYRCSPYDLLHLSWIYESTYSPYNISFSSLLSQKQNQIY